MAIATAIDTVKSQLFARPKDHRPGAHKARESIWEFRNFLVRPDGRSCAVGAWELNSPRHTHYSIANGFRGPEKCFRLTRSVRTDLRGLEMSDKLDVLKCRNFLLK